jgi:diguanylate cyclase (GGDEF)-like protein
VATGLNKLRVFVSSPNEVSKERNLVETVVDELNRTVSPRFRVILETVRWETHVTPGVGLDAQSVINEQIGPYDIYVGILWRRFGTATPRAASGTKEEFDGAYAEWKRTHDIKILFYFRMSGYHPTPDDIPHIEKLHKFKIEVQQSGVFYAEYKEPIQFQALLREHLTRIVINWAPPEPPGIPSRKRKPARMVRTRSRKQLSGLPNTSQLIDDLRDILNAGTIVSIIFFDIDRFRQLNNDIGDLLADQLLSVVVQVILRISGGRGKLYRIGGDEFVLMLRNFDVVEAKATAERIRTNIEESRLGPVPTLTVSLGVACNRKTDRVIRSALSLIAEAHDANFVSKLNGRNQITTAPLTKENQEVLDIHRNLGPQFSEPPERGSAGASKK